MFISILNKGNKQTLQHAYAVCDRQEEIGREREQSRFECFAQLKKLISHA